MAVSPRQPFKRAERKLAGRARLVTTPEASRRMAAVRTEGTAAERAMRLLARRAGLRFRTRNRDLPGSPDLANRSKRFAIFVNGCYWHRHKSCAAATTPKTNTDFWVAKFQRNIERDGAVRRELNTLGYEVLVFWECELKRPAAIERRLKRLAARLCRGRDA